ncbi:MAG: inositol monophosphatase family protein, partial [Myxococcota bacterium]
MSTLVDIHNCACRWAREAGARIRERLGAVRVEHKGAVDLVTDADLDSERHLLSRIGERFSHHSVWAEESGADGTGSAPFRWIVDPLDGTTNFAHQIPH